MKERPILFSGAMVRALLRGTDPKTQTRRVVKLPHNNRLGQWEPTTIGGENGGRTLAGDTLPLQGGIWHTRTGDSLMCPHGQPGDRLWVRETFAHMCRGNAAPESRRDDDAIYRADGFTPDEYVYGSWKPSIHMPRWASRITLEVTGVRVERLREISEADAEAEGIDFLRHVPDVDETLTPPQLFMCLWDSLNAARGYGWDANPWVWIVEFRRIEA